MRNVPYRFMYLSKSPADLYNSQYCFVGSGTFRRWCFTGGSKALGAELEMFQPSPTSCLLSASHSTKMRDCKGVPAGHAYHHRAPAAMLSFTVTILS